MKYVIIAVGAVDNEIFIKAHRVLAFARQELELPMIEIKWFVSPRKAVDYADDQKIGSFENVYEDIVGTFRNDEPLTIYIDPTCGQLTKAVLHETFHAFQFNKCYGLTDEPTAYAYGECAFMRIYMQGVEDGVYFDHLAGKDWSVATASKEQTKKAQDKRPSKQAAMLAKQSGGIIRKRAYGHIVPMGKGNR